MRTLNFIRTLTAEQHRSLHRWWIVSCGAGFIAASALIVLTAMSGYEIMLERTKYGGLQAKKSQYAALKGRQQQLVQEQKALRQKKDMVNGWRKELAWSSAFCHALAQAAQQQVLVESCTWQPQSISLVMSCPTKEQALAAVHKVTPHEHYKKLRVQSLQPTKEGAWRMSLQALRA